jgi:hypothetical protein
MLLDFIAKKSHASSLRGQPSHEIDTPVNFSMSTAAAAAAGETASVPAACPLLSLRKFDNSSQHSLTSLKNFTLATAINDWIKYKLSATSKKGFGFTTLSNSNNITKMKFVVRFALRKAEEWALEAYHVLLIPEPREDNPGHATWGSNVSNAAKEIEAKVIEFLLEENSMAKRQEGTEPDPKKQRKVATPIRQNATINKVKELIDELANENK